MFKSYGAIGALLLSAGLQAAVIPGLFNTGVDGSGVQVADANGIADPHWFQNGNLLTPGITYNINRAFGSPIYTDETTNVGNGSTASRWISVNGDGGPGAFNVPFVLTFDLTGFDPATASITGRWGTDNCGTAQLNGGAAFNTISACSTSASFTGWTPFSVSSGFTAGLNTLTFNTQNVGGGVGAMRVEFLSSDATSTVPEPGTYALMGTALVALGWMRKRQRQ